MPGRRKEPGTAVNSRPGSGHSKVPAGSGQGLLRAREPGSRRAMLVVNPVAGSGRASYIWNELEEVLVDLGLDFDYRLTEHRAHATVIAREAAEAGYGTVVAVGNDGTSMETITGIMLARCRERPRLGVIPCPAGPSKLRVPGVPMDWKLAASVLMSGRRRRIDIGRMEYQSTEGTAVAFFTGGARLGFYGEAAEKSEGISPGVSRLLGSRGVKVYGLAATAVGFREKDIQLQVDDRSYRVLATGVSVTIRANYFPSTGTEPLSQRSEEMFEVLVQGAGFGTPLLGLPADVPPPERGRAERMLTRGRLARNMVRMRQIDRPENESFLLTRGARVRASCTSRMVLMTDGQMMGTGPFDAQLLPGALEVCA